jgi:Kef-type K+ transport system membrane component KefB
VGISNGIISAELFAVTVVMVLVTTLATPLLLRRAFPAPRPAEAQQPAAPTPAE